MTTERTRFYDNTNIGALFPNDKQGNARRPDYTGKLNVEGKDYKVAAWARQSQRGDQYLRMTVGPDTKGT